VSDRPSRGEIWFVDFAPVRGHEQSGLRPGLVLSVDEFNRSTRELVMAIPGTTVFRPIPGRTEVRAPAGGLPKDTYFLCDQLRTLSIDRFHRRVGSIPERYVLESLEHIRLYLGL
jgi:mRNA interferase MazF